MPCHLMLFSWSTGHAALMAGDPAKFGVDRYCVSVDIIGLVFLARPRDQRVR